MLQTNLRKISYLKNGIDETEYTKTAYERLEKLQTIEALRREGCSEKTALKSLKMTRSTYFRWKKNYRLYGLVGLEKIVGKI